MRRCASWGEVATAAAAVWFFFLGPAGAAPAVVVEPPEVAVGQSFTARVEGAPPGSMVKWRVNANAKFLRADSMRREATFEATRAGEAVVTAAVGGIEPKATVRIVEGKSPGDKPTGATAIPMVPVPAPIAGAIQVPPKNYEEFAEAVLSRFLKTGQASERDMLYLMSHPDKFNALINPWKGRGSQAAELVQRVLTVRQRIIQRVIRMLQSKGGAARTLAVVALGSWSDLLNPNAGDLDAVVRGGRAAVQEFNAALDAEINRLIGIEGDDVLRVAMPNGITLTVERFEIFVSTMEDFGYGKLLALYRDAVKRGGKAGADMLREGAEQILLDNLRAQQLAALNPEMYGGASGQNFAKNYLQSKGKAWIVSPNGTLRPSQGFGSLTDDMLRELGLTVEAGSVGAFNFSRIATEYVEWTVRAGRGAREQAKGIERAMQALSPEQVRILQASEEHWQAYLAARVLSKADRASLAEVAGILDAFGLTPEKFSELGERLLWDAVGLSNIEAMNRVSDALRHVAELRAAGKAIDAEAQNIFAALLGNEQLAGYAKLRPDHLKRLALEIPEGVQYADEIKALLELMAEGMAKDVDDAARLLVQLIDIARRQGRLGTSAASDATKLARAQKALPAEVDAVIAGLRRDLAEVASIHQLGGVPMDEALQIMRQYRQNAPTLILDDQTRELITWLCGRSDVELLRIGFRESEIAVLREIARARKAGLDPGAVGRAARKGSPKRWGAVVAYVGIGGAIATYQMIKAANDPNSPDEAIADAVYDTFPTFGLFVEGLPTALGEADAGPGWDNWSLEQVRGKKLAGDVAMAALEIVGLAFPAAGAVMLTVYVGGTVGMAVMENAEERALVQTLYRAMDENGDFNTSAGKRTFLTLPPPQIERTADGRHVQIVHTIAYNFMYGPEGDILLQDNEGKTLYETSLREAVRAYAQRRFWAGNKKLEDWQTAVGRYLPGLDLDQVESWRLAEVSEQARDVSGKPFRVGAHMARRYVLERDLLTEAAIQHLLSRVTEMKRYMANFTKWRDRLAEIEKGLAMDGRIVPNAKSEQNSLTGVVVDTAFTSNTQIERELGIWKRYIKTYGEALDFLNGRIAQVFGDAGLDVPPGDTFYGLTGVEGDDAPKIQKVYEEFQGTFSGAVKDFKAAKGGAPDMNDGFDADAWGRLLSVSLRLIGPTTETREEKLRAEREEILDEIRAHYADGRVSLATRGPDPAQPKVGDVVRFSAEVRRDKEGGPPAEIVWLGEDRKTVVGRGGAFELTAKIEGPAVQWVAAESMSGAPGKSGRVAETKIPYSVAAKDGGDGQVMSPGDDGTKPPDGGPDKPKPPDGGKTTMTPTDGKPTPPDGGPDKPKPPDGDKTTMPPGDQTATVKPGELEGDKNVQLKGPSEIAAGDIFDIAAVLPGNLASRVVRVRWENDGRSKYTPEGKYDYGYVFAMDMVGRNTSSVIEGPDGLKAQIQCGFPPGPATLLVKAEVNLQNATPFGETIIGRLPIRVRPLDIAMAVPANWKAEPFDSRGGSGWRRDYLFGVELSREDFKSDIAMANASMTVGLGSYPPQDAAGMAEALRELSLCHEPGKPFAIGEYQGLIVERPSSLGRPGSDPIFPLDYFEGRRGRQQANRHGGRAVVAVAQKGLYRISIHGQTTCSVWDGDNSAAIAQATAQATAAFSEMKAMIAGLKLATGGGLTTVPAGTVTVPPVTGPLAVKVVADALEPKLGQTANVSAEVSGGTAPYEYTWTGDHAGQGEKVTFVSAKAGEYALSVTVKDADGATASGQVTFKVAAVSGMIQGLADRVAYGQTISIRGTVAGGVPTKMPGAPAGAGGAGAVVDLDGEEFGTIDRYKWIWQSSPNVTFDPPVSQNGSTRVTWDRMGEVKIWAQIVGVDQGSEETVGEVEQVTVEVVAPGFSVAFDPEAGAKVGQEVKATVRTEPTVPENLITYQWGEPPSSNRMEVKDNASEIRFKVKDPSPVSLKATAKVPTLGDVIGEVAATYSASQYIVKVKVEEAETTKPKVWDPAKGGIKTLPKGTYAGDEQIRLRAEIEGEPKPEDVRWKWTVNGGTSISNDISQTPTVSRHETGSISATVEARDKDGVLLGTGSINLSVTVAPDKVNPVMVTAKADRATIRSGERTWLRVEVKGGTPPYSYQWSGAAKGSAQAVEFLGEKAGDAVATVAVKDSKGKTGNAQVTVKVEPSEIAVSVSAGKARVFVGETVDLTASAKGGTEPYKFTWAAPAAGQAAKAQFAPDKAGDVELAVAAEDKFGNKGEGKVKVAVAALEVTIEGLKDQEIVGASRALQVRTPLPGQVQSVLSSEPGLAFTPATAPQGKANVTFDKAGEYRVRAEAQVERDSAWVTVGRSKDYAVSVIVPKFEIAFEPAEAFVGQSVKAMLAMEPSLAPGSSEVAWQGLPGGSGAKGAQVVFKPGSTKPIDMTATVKAVPGGAPIGEAKGTFAAKPLEVKISVTSAGARSVTDPKTGKVIELPSGTYAAGAEIGLRASVSGGMSPAIFDWSAKGGEVLAPATGSSVKVRGEGKGPCEVEVVAKDRDGGKIGRGSIPLDVLAPESGTTPDDGMEDPEKGAQRLVEEGYALEQAGEIAAAIEKYEAALALVKDEKLAARIAELRKKLLPGAPDTPGAPDANTTAATSGMSAPIPVAVPQEIVEPAQSTGNVGGVQNGPTAPTLFETADPYVVTFIQTYHWNYGKGKEPGTVALRHSDGTTYGPWPTSGRDGQGGVRNAYWVCEPNVLLKPGTYTVIDSDPSTWAQNAQAGGCGFVEIKGATKKAVEVATGVKLPETPGETSTAGPSMPPTAPATPVAPPTVDDVPFDGTYSGRFEGGAGGDIRFTVAGGRVNGTISGSYQGSQIVGTFAGPVDDAGNMTTILTGKFINESRPYPFTGKILGALRGGLGAGTWDAENQWGKPKGEWRATRGGG